MKKLSLSKMGVGTLGEVDTWTGWMTSVVDCPWPAVDAEPACLHSMDVVWIESRNGIGGCQSCCWDWGACGLRDLAGQGVAQSGIETAQTCLTLVINKTPMSQQTESRTYHVVGARVWQRPWWFLVGKAGRLRAIEAYWYVMPDPWICRVVQDDFKFETIAIAGVQTLKSGTDKDQIL